MALSLHRHRRSDFARCAKIGCKGPLLVCCPGDQRGDTMAKQPSTQTSEVVSHASTTSGSQKASMEAGRSLSRRDFLRVSAMAAAGAVIAACGGQTPQSGTGGATTPGAAMAGAGTADGATTVAGAAGVPGATAAVDVTTGPLKASGNYREAPALAELVKAGKLPAVVRGALCGLDFRSVCSEKAGCAPTIAGGPPACRI